MDRLTNHDSGRRLVACRANYESWNAIYDRLAAYEDTGLEPKEITEYLNATDEYVGASEESRLIVLPCKVGDRVWGIVKGVGYDGGDAVCQATVAYITVRINGIIFHTKDDGNMIGCFYLTDFGKTVFLTREEAEVVLGGDKDG